MRRTPAIEPRPLRSAARTTHRTHGNLPARAGCATHAPPGSPGVFTHPKAAFPVADARPAPAPSIQEPTGL